jgi:hypothetical protein
VRVHGDAAVGRRSQRRVAGVRKTLIRAR